MSQPKQAFNIALELDDIKLLVALLKHNDPSAFFSRGLRDKIIKQTDAVLNQREEEYGANGGNVIIQKTEV